MTYRREQRASWILAIFTPIAGIIAAAAVFAPDFPLGVRLVMLGVLVLFLVLVLTFSRMTVEVNPEHAAVSFGWGWPKKVVPRRAITGVRPVRNRWWYGWGIRWIPGGWLWNVRGLDAVELRLDTGKVLRIGTAEPNELVAAFGGSR